MKNMYSGIAQKIILPVIAAAILLLSLVVVAEIGLNSINGLLANVVDRNAERTLLALGALDNINLATIKEKNLLLEKGNAALEKNSREYGDLMIGAAEKLNRLKDLTDPQDLPSLLKLTDLASQYRKLVQESELPLIKEGKVDQAYALSFKEGDGGGRMLRQTVRAGLEKIVENDKNEMRSNRREAVMTGTQTKNSLVLMAAIGLSVALIWISLPHIPCPFLRIFGKKAAFVQGMKVETDKLDDEKIAVITRALEIFKDNAAEAKRIAEAEEKDCARLLESVKKD